jgi:hypothetical protein
MAGAIDPRLPAAAFFPVGALLDFPTATVVFFLSDDGTATLCFVLAEMDVMFSNYGIYLML